MIRDPTTSMIMGTQSMVEKTPWKPIDTPRYTIWKGVYGEWTKTDSGKVYREVSFESRYIGNRVGNEMKECKLQENQSE